jgi:asparagine synthase (glutamine-hydrolysing)
MCGIAGYYFHWPGQHHDLLRGMGAVLMHRGPDSCGDFIDDRVGLIHTRLSIIDLAGGAQPLISDDGNLILIANGEIYNHIELRATLEKRGCRFASHSDCETILHAYATFGPGFIEHLCGMFAFALYDIAAGRLILARDRLGMKPLFLHQGDDGVTFASEIKALLPVLPQQPPLNDMALAQYLQNQNSSGRETLFHAVERVLPGEYIVVEKGRVTERQRYWSPLHVRTRDISLDDAMDEFDALMATVMQQHMRSDVPFGLFLSGGVDSTTLLGLLSRYKDEPIRTFSVGFPRTRVGDELETAERLARHFGSRHTVLRPDGQTMLQRLVYSVWAADDLMRDFANLPTLLLAEEAGRELKVVFSGEGGDESFAGYGRYHSSGLERWLKRLVFPGSGGFRTSPNFSASLGRRIFGARLRQAQRRWREPLIAAWRETPTQWSDLQRMQYTDLVTALPDNLLVKADRMLMAWSVEGRLPFVDHRVVEFGLGLPDRIKVQGRQGKVFLKRWAGRFLPPEHLWQRKRGFRVPVGEWLRGDYLAQIGVALSRSEGIREWFDMAGVNALLARQQARGDVSKNVMALLQFAIWHRLFIAGDGGRPPATIDPVQFLLTRAGQA